MATTVVMEGPLVSLFFVRVLLEFFYNFLLYGIFGTLVLTEEKEGGGGCGGLGRSCWVINF